MNVDEVRDALRTFADELSQLDDGLMASLARLRSHHDELSGLWQDATARRYRRQWQAVADPAETYVARDAAAYRHFIETRLRHLDRYLGDG